MSRVARLNVDANIHGVGLLMHRRVVAEMTEWVLRVSTARIASNTPRASGVWGKYADAQGVPRYGEAGLCRLRRIGGDGLRVQAAMARRG